MNTFTWVFITALLVSSILQVWLTVRNMNHVRRRRDRVPEAFRNTVPLEDHQKAADYTAAKGGFGIIELAYGVVLILAWTLGGGLNLLDELWRSAALGPLATGVGVVVSAFLLMGILDTPFSAYDTFSLEARFGFNRTTIGTFIADHLLHGLVVAALGTPLVWVILLLMQDSGSLWWLYAWGVWMGFTLFMMWAYPVLIAPLFNRFKPLEDDELRRRIQALLEKCGFTSKGIFVMNGSRRSGHGNAYFTGLGNNKRIVFFDTLLENLETSEIEAVLAHELGHFRLKHVQKRLLSTAALSLAGLYLLAWLMSQNWFYHGLGISQPSAYLGLMLFLLVSPIFGVFLQPLFSALSRRHEFEADAYAAKQADPADLIRALVKLYKKNASTLTPDPLYSAFHDSHPPAPARVAQLSVKSGT
ncbi:MAG: M48 family metallopeptidase [Gammaproteobacteria bacterium]